LTLAADKAGSAFCAIVWLLKIAADNIRNIASRLICILFSNGSE
jgi:hypothetical protein